MTKEELKKRTKNFSLQILSLSSSFPKTREGDIIARQIIRSGTSVGANYRAVCRARSTADFISKLGIVLEEADETLFWLELIVESHMLSSERIANLMKEANELVSIFTSAIITTKKKNQKL